MDPTAPVPLTRAAARSRATAAVSIDEPAAATVPAAPVDRIGLARTIALAGGAVGGACLMLVIASLVGISSIDPPTTPKPVLEQVAVSSPAPTPSRQATPTPSPTADAVPVEETAESVSPVVADPAAPDPEPSPSDPTVPPADEETVAETGPGKSASAPGRNKPEKP